MFGWLLMGLVSVKIPPPVTMPSARTEYRVERPRRDQREVWSGSGQIISGPGSGGTLRLTLEVKGDRIRSLEGPAVDRRDDWDFRYAESYLYVTLTRRNGQVINFNLVKVE
ncbi:hypothetical protein [Candidatus Cyanaurora vandensis]|uniref:hypothetical protein n=1 Tax=Candidatus Cyanaurora vandensis TaxID=2714958 RepID=UPI00257B65E2|nr:hypothetical protein [Candidatus Cyanaurora vandensis]